MKGSRVDYGFGFDVPAFSNCILHIELIENSLDCKGDLTPNKMSKGKDLAKENANSLDSKGESSPIRNIKGKDLDKENESSLDPKGDDIPIRQNKGKDLDKEKANSLHSKGDLDKENANSLDSKGDCVPIRENKGKDLDNENENSLDPRGDLIPIKKSKGKELDKESSWLLLGFLWSFVWIFVDKVRVYMQRQRQGNSLDAKGDCIPNRKSQGMDLDKENVVEVKTLHINSLILAAKSPFFYKLFKNEMRELQQRDVTLKINASEDAALMEVLKFIYSDTLSSTTSPDLLGMLVVADRFKVTSCMRECSLLLQKMPMSQESALSYLELPASVVGSEVVQPLINAAKKYLVARYSDFNKSRKQVMGLPICAVEAVLGSDGLQVDSEDDVFDFILKWASGHYPEVEERQEVLTKRLAPCICFSFMSHSKLKQVLDRPDFVSKEVLNLVSDALLKLVSDAPSNANQSIGRIYKLRPIKVAPLKFSQPRCIVYFDLTRGECANLSTSAYLMSQSFCLGGRRFFLSAQLSNKGNKQEESFGLFLHMTADSESCTVDCEFAVIKQQSKEFQDKVKCNFNFDNSVPGAGWGRSNLFRVSWMVFINKDSKYFVDGILHLRADLSIAIENAR